MREQPIYLTQFFEDRGSRAVLRSRSFKISHEDLFNLDPFGSGKAVGVHVIPGGFDSQRNRIMVEYCYYDLNVYRFRVKDAKAITDLERCKLLDEYWKT